MDDLNPAATEKSELKPCGICGRTFRPDTLERHYKICQKASEKKRKIFDSRKQRAVEGEQTNSSSKTSVTSQPTASKQIPKKKPAQSKRPAPANKDSSTRTTPKEKKNESSKPKSNWREKHEELIRTIRMSREGDQNNNDTKSSKPYVPSDYVQCPGCQRNFNQRAAERHIPWCQEKQAKTPKSPVVDEAKEKLFARVKYRVPKPGKAKKAAKVKTVVYPETEENPQYIEREKETHSSPPSFVENRIVTSNGNAYIRRNKREPKSGSRSSEIKYSPSPTDSFGHIIKFKEKFPNHTNKRGLDLEESLTAEQLHELLRCSRLGDSRCPKTVPGVRLTGSNNRNNWTSGWNKVTAEDNALPEVSSSEDTWMAKYGWTKDLEASTSSSGSSSGGSLPPMSRESPSEAHLLLYCHQCHHKFPLIGAKYCCECGARRRGIGTVSQTV